MRRRSWLSFAGILILWASTIGILGWMTGYPVIVLLTAGLAWLAWHIVNLWRLYRWVLNPECEVPQSKGVWREIFNGIGTATKIEREKEDRYRETIREFRSLTDALPDAMLVLDENGAVTWCNVSAIQLLGLKLPEDLGKPVTILSRDPVFSQWLADPAEIESPLDIPSPQGDGRWLTISSVSYRENERLIILRNITGIHNVDKIRRDFVANISHELRTPLTVLRGYLELLEDHPSDDVSEPVKRMIGPAFQMQTLLDDLLELSRLQSEELRGEDQWVNVPATLERLREQAEGLSRGDHRIEFEVDQQLFLLAVTNDLESAFSNLITNAIKYTPRGGHIKVTWNQTLEGPQLRVSDNGIGIPTRDVPRVTERFYRVGSDRARETGGTGLGLAIVKHVLQAHQAQLTITSDLGLGSEFICTFPAKRARTDKSNP